MCHPLRVIRAYIDSHSVKRMPSVSPNLSLANSKVLFSISREYFHGAERYSYSTICAPAPMISYGNVTLNVYINVPINSLVGRTPTSSPSS